MKYDLSKSDDILQFERRRIKAIKNKEFIEVKGIKDIKSNLQNKYLHLLLNLFAIEYGETLEYIKQEVYKKVANKELFQTSYKNRKTGNSREDWRSVASLDSAELTLSIDRFRNYASKEANIYLPLPNETEYLRQIEKDIELHKQYL